MKKQILKIFSIFLSITTLMPMTLVVNANGDKDKTSENIPVSPAKLGITSADIGTDLSIDANSSAAADINADSTADINANASASSTATADADVNVDASVDVDMDMKDSTFEIEDEKEEKEKKTEETTTRLQRARRRQENRKKFRLLAQKFTSISHIENYAKEIKPNSDGCYYSMLPTPFGPVTFKFKEKNFGEEKTFDVIVVDNEITNTSYNYIFNGDTYGTDMPTLRSYVGISDILSIEGQKELARIILRYLETPANERIVENREFFGLTRKYFLRNPQYFNLSLVNLGALMECGRFAGGANKLKRYAAILCGIFLMTDSGPNRMCDGGKSIRATLRAISAGHKTFREAFTSFSPSLGEVMPWYPIAIPNAKTKDGKIIYYSGRIARTLSKIDHSEIYDLPRSTQEAIQKNSREIEEYMSESSDEE